MRRRRSLPRRMVTRPSTSAQHPVRPPLTRTLTDTDTNNPGGVSQYCRGFLQASVHDVASGGRGLVERRCYFFLGFANSTRPSLNLMLAWLPLQNGLFTEAPHRHNVTRFRIS